MKDYLKTFDEDTIQVIGYKECCGRLSDSVKLIHKPTEIIFESINCIRNPYIEFIKYAYKCLRKELKAHYEQEELKRTEAQRTEWRELIDKHLLMNPFKEKEKDKLPDELRGKGWIPLSEAPERFNKLMDKILKDDDGKKESKKPLHPGNLALNLLREANYNPVYAFDVYGVVASDKLLKKVVNLEDIDETMAYNLANEIKGTDIRFWMDLQERYDSYKGESE